LSDAITIRRLTPDDDLADLLALTRAFFHEYAAHHAAFFAVATVRDEDIVGRFERTARGDGGITIVALDDGRMVGYATVFALQQPPFYQVGTVGTISGLMVHRDYRRRGIATQLIRAAKAFFRESGVRYCTVYTAVANEAAIRLYKREGLVPLQTVMLGDLGDGE